MSALREPLLAWYDEHARDLPWREPSATPWAVLVSEFMLQQTPVARVLPVYERWLTDWPTPADLAAEPTGAAVRAWGRLGYPRRALRLHAAATAIVAEHGGEVPVGLRRPDRPAGRRRLHGGRRRVLRVPPPARRPRHQRPAGAGPHGQRRRVPRAPPSPGPSATWPRPCCPRTAPTAAAWAVATMELGATVCVAAAPRCADCPVADLCAWRAAGYPAYDGPPRKGQAYDGTDRQCRGPAARRAPRQRRPGAPQPARRRVAGRPSSVSAVLVATASWTTGWSPRCRGRRGLPRPCRLSLARPHQRRRRWRRRASARSSTACSCTGRPRRAAGRAGSPSGRVQERHRTRGPGPAACPRRPGGPRPPRSTPRWPRARRTRRARARTARAPPPRRTSAGSAPAAGSVTAAQRSSTAARTSGDGGSARISATERSLETRSTVATRSSLLAKW